MFLYIVGSMQIECITPVKASLYICAYACVMRYHIGRQQCTVAYIMVCVTHIGVNVVIYTASS